MVWPLMQPWDLRVTLPPSSPPSLPPSLPPEFLRGSNAEAVSKMDSIMLISHFSVTGRQGHGQLGSKNSPAYTLLYISQCLALSNCPGLVVYQVDH